MPDSEKSTESFQEKVDLAVKGMSTNEEGVHVLPDGLDDDVKVAANSEKRRRDTQASFTKSQLDLKVVKEENNKLRKLLKPELSLTPEQKEELLDLKGTDPDKWKDKLDAYNEEAKTKLDHDLGEVEAQAEISRRALVLQDFMDSNEGFVINDRVLNEDIPAKMKQKLVDGVVTFEAFLLEAKEYLAKGEKQKEPDLNSVGGGASPADRAVDEDIRTSYKKEVY